MSASQIYIPFRKGYSVSIRYLSPSGGALNILSGNDIAIHVNIRDNEKALVLNTWMNQAWGPEERPAGFPFDINREIFVSVKAGADGFYISAGIVGTQTPFTYKYAYRLPETKALDQIYVDYANLKALAILPIDSELINQEIKPKLESFDQLSYRLREQETSVFDLFAGEYICAVKWGGWSGTWHEGTEHLVISHAGEVQFRSRFGVATIKHLTVEGNILSWSFDDNQTAASFTFKVDSEDSYFWYEGKQTGKLLEGWLQYPKEGRIDFRGKFAGNEAKTPNSQSHANGIESGTEPTYLEFSDINSYKFYEVSVDDIEVIVRYGRIGTSGQTSRTTYPTKEKAQTAARKKINEKLKKGYVQTAMSK